MRHLVDDSKSKMASTRIEVQLILGFLSFFLTAVCPFASDQFIVTHAPSYLHYRPDGGRVPISEIPELVKSTYGYSLKKDLSWQGLQSDSLFHRPKANVIFSVTGLGEANDITVPHVAAYDTDADDDRIDTETVAHNILSTTDSPLIIDFSSKTMFDVQAEHPEMFSKISPSMDEMVNEINRGKSALNKYNLGVLNASRPTDVVLLTEIHLVHQLINAIKENPALVKDNTPDFFHFRFGGLKELLIRYGAKSQEVTDAVQLLQTFLQKMTEELKALYNDNVVVQIVTLPRSVSPNLIRKTRSLLQDDDNANDGPPKPGNLASSLDPQYAVVFNIVLWMSILIGVSILAISISIWNMDPGRDSIIYRMTSQRMKKD